MWKLGRKGRAAFVGAAAIAGATVLVGASPSATAEGPVVVQETYGTLRIGIADGVANVLLRKADGSELAQTFTATNKCGLQSSGAPLVSFTPDGGQFGAGLNVNEIGVRAKNNCATDSGRISGGETLTVVLGSGIPSGIEATRAELDVEGKKNADLDYALDGGTAVTTDLPRAASDNGPDAGVGDNSRVILDVPSGFRSIRLGAGGPSDAEISLNGGGDDTYAAYDAAGLVADVGRSLNTADTVFLLEATKQYAGELDCGDVVQAVVTGENPAASSAELRRLDNAGCEPVPYTFEITDDGVLLDKALIGVNGTPQPVHAEVEIEWLPEPAGFPITMREINLDPFNPASPWVPVQWCGLADDLVTWMHPTGTPWCLIADLTTPSTGGTMVQTQTYDGAGDPMWR
jgi:hypothetical protein